MKASENKKEKNGKIFSEEEWVYTSLESGWPLKLLN